jgi:hypothetical protein
LVSNCPYLAACLNPLLPSINSIVHNKGSPYPNGVRCLNSNGTENVTRPFASFNFWSLPLVIIFFYFLKTTKGKFLFGYRIERGLEE